MVDSLTSRNATRPFGSWFLLGKYEVLAQISESNQVKISNLIKTKWKGSNLVNNCRQHGTWLRLFLFLFLFLLLVLLPKPVLGLESVHWIRSVTKRHVVIVVAAVAANDMTGVAAFSLGISQINDFVVLFLWCDQGTLFWVENVEWAKPPKWAPQDKIFDMSAR